MKQARALDFRNSKKKREVALYEKYGSSPERGQEADGGSTVGRSSNDRSAKAASTAVAAVDMGGGFCGTRWNR
jgi:hypothetical protein